ncbi:MAG: hypothetical protein LBD21_04025 [Tannerellaceae bacterium]|jgi:ADP-ribose pyrophosphatase YjhB (NUDIX family)|nr:hypothetical protein [Tannerellaceae bacterium]
MEDGEYEDLVPDTSRSSGGNRIQGRSRRSPKEKSLRELLEYVSKNVSVIEDIENIKTDMDKALSAILKACRAKKYIVGAAVGGLLINHEKDEVLLYLRPKDPEKYKWSMPGGSIEFNQTATEALINEYKFITGITSLKPDHLLPLRITNHKDSSKDCKYHYLSPAFTIKNPDRFVIEIDSKIKREKTLNNDLAIVELANKIIPNTETELTNILIQDIKSGRYFLKDWEPSLQRELQSQSHKKYIVKWFKISDIIEDGDKIAEPTKKALSSYVQRTNTIDNVVKETEIILNEAVQSTEDKIKTIILEPITKAIDDTKEKIKAINLDTIIETDA